MNKDEKKIITKFEKNARPVDLAFCILAKEQIAILEGIRKEIAQLRVEIKKESSKQIDDGK